MKQLWQDRRIVLLVIEEEWILDNIYENFLFHPDSLGSIAVISENQFFKLCGICSFPNQVPQFWFPQNTLQSALLLLFSFDI